MKTGEITKSVDIGRPFPGYLPPPKEWSGAGNPNDPTEYVRVRNAWIESFHRLERLAWRGGELYGLFFRGYEDGGVWARLSTEEKRDWFWDNNQRSERLLAIGEDRAVFGHVEEDRHGSVSWTLSIRESIAGH
jgi:hypothetical protein